MRAATPACIPRRTASTAVLELKASYQTVMMDRMTSGGMMAPRQLQMTPAMPAVRCPASAERLTAMAPGVDCAMAAMERSSSLENSRFFQTKYLLIIGTTM